VIVGLACAVCPTRVDIAEPFTWRCPAAGSDDHLLEFVDDGAEPEDDHTSTNPFVRYRRRMAWWAFARANGMSDAATVALAEGVAGDFRITPLGRHAALSEAVGAEVWAKDETGGVAGSHKARHLASIMLHLRAAEELGLLDHRPPLAISSCGNAALAAATLAAREGWPIRVFVPTWMDDAFGAGLDALGAEVNRCPRMTAAGDPAMAGFRAAVAAGAVPFSVQGPANAWCLDGGRTIGWEIAEQVGAAGVEPIAVYVQVGGGAFATCLGAGLGHRVPLVAVQTAGCAPLAAALERAEGFDHPERHWAEVMVPWEEPHSLADGILDDETYDWIGVRRAVLASGGRSLVAPEPMVVAAHDLVASSGPATSPTGTAGVAGLLTDAAGGRVTGPVVVVLSGVER
jgi:threonine dehydratase